ncbi:MAG: protein translocase subunit SecF [Myxococcota bacterium]
MSLARLFHPKQPLNFVGRFRLGIVVAAAIACVSLACLLGVGVNWGIDFLGGTEMQVRFAKPVSSQAVRETLESIGLDKNQVQSYGAPDNNELLIRVERLNSIGAAELGRIQRLIREQFSRDGKTDASAITATLDPDAADRLLIHLPIPQEGQKEDDNRVSTQQRQAVVEVLKQAEISINDKNDIARRDAINRVSTNAAVASTKTLPFELEGISRRIERTLSKTFGQVTVRRVEFVDSQVSKQLRTDGFLAVLYALLAILVYIAVRFDVLFAPGAIVALVHDALGTLLIFTVGGREFNLPCVAALLTIVGYSINNTIVVYDRMREAIPPLQRDTLSRDELVGHINRSLTDTLSRTINTSLTTLFASVALWIWAGGTIAIFAQALSFGIVLGGFSTTFVAPAVYLRLHQWAKHRRETQATTKRDTKIHEDQTQLSREDKLRGVV